MDWLQLLRAVFALAIVLGLILALAYVLKRYLPQLMARMQVTPGKRRLHVVETLVLDPARRLVLVRLDDEERLILLGEGHELIEPRHVSNPSQKSSAAVPSETPTPVSGSISSRVSGRQRVSLVPADDAKDANDDLF